MKAQRLKLIILLIIYVQFFNCTAQFREYTVLRELTHFADYNLKTTEPIPDTLLRKEILYSQDGITLYRSICRNTLFYFIDFQGIRLAFENYDTSQKLFHRSINWSSKDSINQDSDSFVLTGDLFALDFCNLCNITLTHDSEQQYLLFIGPDSIVNNTFYSNEVFFDIARQSYYCISRINNKIISVIQYDYNRKCYIYKKHINLKRILNHDLVLLKKKEYYYNLSQILHAIDN